MERELWPLLYRLIRRVANDFSQKNVRYQPWVVVAVSLWAALHDRPLSWACNPKNWSSASLRPCCLPSPSTLSRRAHSVATGVFRRALEQTIRDSQEPALLAFLDGKPLSVPAISGDPDAGFGRGAGEKSKGYKLHTVISDRPLPEAWEVTPIQVAETKVAETLVGRLEYGGYLLGDGNYDANGVFDAAAANGYALRTPHPQANAGKGHHYQSPHRLRSIEACRTDFGKALLKARGEIERRFGTLASFGGGLAPLPAWVRRLHRVRSWVWDKLLINAARILKNQGLTSILQ
jgi:hypothetical protein